MGGDAQERAFKGLKAKFSSTPVLIKKPIRSHPFQLHTNLSVLGL
jgi:hypothetical protein